jgi:CRISPR-associated protein Cmr2
MQHQPWRAAAANVEWSDIQRCKRPDELPSRQSRVSLSVGVVLAPAHTPVFYLEDLASQLLKSAKRHAKLLRDRGYRGGTVDFLALKSLSMVSGSVQTYRASPTVTRDHGRLYARPYSLAEMRTLLESITRLKRARFPKNQLYRLRESLAAGSQRSTLDYLYFLSRSDETRQARLAIQSLWNPGGGADSHPWRATLADRDVRETIWPDIVELYDFVPRDGVVWND